MKKFVKGLSLLLVCIMCVVCVSGCNNEKSITPNDVIQALKDAGFNKTYFEDGKVYIDDTGMYISDLRYDRKMEISSPYPTYLYIRNYSELEDVIPVLNAIIPLWDDSFDNYGAKVVAELNYKGTELFDYNDIRFMIENIQVLNENYMNDVNDHNEYFTEEALCVDILYND